MKIECIIPVYNEEVILDRSVTSVVSHFRSLRREFQIKIIDNGSTDRTSEIAGKLSRLFPEVSVLFIPYKGRGNALKTGWMTSSADIVAYMDVDLASDLNSFQSLCDAIEHGGADVAVGSRHVKGAHVHRSVKRGIASRCYNILLRIVLRSPVADAQCGFKALRSDVAKAILPYVESRNWFFDTELLILAARAGFVIQEIPVEWNEGVNSKVNVVSTALEDLRGIWRLRKCAIKSKHEMT